MKITKAKLREFIKEEIKRLNEYRMKPDMRDKFDDLEWTRKPSKWSLVETLRANDVGDEVRYEIMNKLPIVEAGDSRIENFEKPLGMKINDEELTHSPFIFIYKNTPFLIDSSGYKYARYVLKLRGFRLN